MTLYIKDSTIIRIKLEVCKVKPNGFLHPLQALHLQAPHRHHFCGIPLYLSYVSYDGFHCQNQCHIHATKNEYKFQCVKRENRKRPDTIKTLITFLDFFLSLLCLFGFLDSSFSSFSELTSSPTL